MTGPVSRSAPNPCQGRPRRPHLQVGRAPGPARGPAAAPAAFQCKSASGHRDLDVAVPASVSALRRAGSGCQSACRPQPCQCKNDLAWPWPPAQWAVWSVPGPAQPRLRPPGARLPPGAAWHGPSAARPSPFKLRGHLPRARLEKFRVFWISANEYPWINFQKKISRQYLHPHLSI